MPIPALPNAVRSGDDNTLIDPGDHSSSAVVPVRCNALSDILENSSDESSQDIPRSALARPSESAGAILQLIRDSAYEILESTGGQSPHPTASAAAGMADNQSQMQNISKMSDDIVRNLARILDLRAEEIEGQGDHEMKDAIAALPPVTARAVSSSPGLLRARRPALKSRGSRLVCRGCHCTATPKWRPGPHGPATLCNVCGLLYAKRMGIIEGLHDG